MTLLESLVEYTGIQDPIVADLITGILFVVAILMFLGMFIKFVFRLI